MTALLVCNGPLDEVAAALLRAAAASADLVVGVDGGARHLAALGLTPHVVTGDFDSIPEETLAALEAAGTRVVPTPDQDYTDLDKALAYVLRERGASRVRVYAASGGRLDHVYAALSALLKYGRGPADVRLVDGTGETWPVTGELILTGDDLPGRALSLLAFGRVTGVHLTGVHWPLRGETLAPGERDGTSNLVTETTVTIQAAEGNLLVMLHHAVGGSPHPRVPSGCLSRRGRGGPATVSVSAPREPDTAPAPGTPLPSAGEAPGGYPGVRASETESLP